MADQKVEPESLDEHLTLLQEKGIQTDRRHLLKDMCGQFADPREYIREYVVNGYDAGASRIFIDVREDEDTYTVGIEDNGRGMDRQGVQDFATVFRSVKSGDPARIIGCHGIGKLSVAAVEGQCGFYMITSTGSQCWRMRAGCLLDETPLRFEHVRARMPRGTRFEITFKKSGNSVREEMLKLVEVLEKYVKYLPIEIGVEVPDANGAKTRRHWIGGTWTAFSERFGRAFSFALSGHRYEVVLGIGVAAMEVYQNRVLVSDSYGLLSLDLDRRWSIPHLRIRVDSPDFQLPFGRHRLMNEGVLRTLAYYLRSKVLPRYAADLCRIYESSTYEDYGISPIQIEDIVCSLMSLDSLSDRSWCQLPVFRVLNDQHHPRYSLNDLRAVAKERGVIYIEGPDNPGVDYSVFDSPVLSRLQPTGTLDLFSKTFKKELVNLGVSETVLVAPAGSSPELGPRERALQRNLRFHPDALRRARRRGERRAEGSSSPMRSSCPTIDQVHRLLGVCEEARQAEQDLAEIRWQVNYLVGRDGKTACTTHRFLVRDKTVYLNLHHKDVQRLLVLSDKSPNLAGHWGLAMCLAEGNTILPHLTPEARADLIVTDAVAKAGNPIPDDPEEVPAGGLGEMDYREFLRNIGDEDFGLD